LGVGKGPSPPVRKIENSVFCQKFARMLDSTPRGHVTKTHLNVLLGGETPKQADVLKRSRNSGVAHPLGAEGRYLVPIEPDGASRRLSRTRDRI
jgi:hypothetical protein